jgi:hypothetical protein
MQLIHAVGRVVLTGAKRSFSASLSRMVLQVRTQYLCLKCNFDNIIDQGHMTFVGVILQGIVLWMIGALGDGLSGPDYIFQLPI